MLEVSNDITLKDVSTQDLLKEVERRKQDAIPEAVNMINKGLDMLREFNIYPTNSAFPQFRIIKLSNTKAGLSFVETDTKC